MGTQNFRVKNGLEVGSATTVTQTSAFVGSNFAVSGVSTFQSDVFVNGTLVAGGSGGGGGSFGADVVTRNLYASGISTFAGLLTGTTASFSGDVTVGGVLKYEDVVNVDSVGIATARAGLRITGGGLDVVGVSTFDDSVIFDSTGSIQVPVGNTSERPGIAVTGQLRYNSELTSFEGYGPGGEWGSLGGVKDVDGDTYIIPESSPNADEDILYFYNAGTNTVAISSTTATINVNLDVDGHTELDALNVAGIVTATRFDGDLNALGKTYYVATTGSDSNSGNNINEPFLTIEQALSVAGNGNVINISAGTYEETCPLTVPRGVTVKGAGLRATTIKPTDATKTNNVFELNDISTLEDFTVRNSYYDSSADTGYAFAYATGIAITTRSPYIQRVTVLNAGSIVSSSDPYGYDTPDNPPTSYLAGRGALVDGSLVASNSLEAGMLFNEATFFTPNNKGIVLTNGARAEYLNCFHYFASQAIVGLGGTVGIAGTAEARLKFRTPGVTPSVNMQMNSTGAKIWEEMTGNAFTQGSQIAIVLDDIVYSAPGVTTGPISGGSSEISGSFTVQEAQDLANSGWNYTSSSSFITLSFWVRSAKTGTYIVEFYNNNSAGFKIQSQSYTISSADTWEKKTITIDGDTALGFQNTTDAELLVYWWLAAGTTYNSGSTSAAFQTYSNANHAAGQAVNLLDSTSNEWYLTGVQLEVGSQASPFEHEPVGVTLRKCQRYYSQINGPVHGYAMWTYSSICSTHFYLPEEMRTIPSVTFTGTTNQGNSNSVTNDTFSIYNHSQWIGANSATGIVFGGTNSPNHKTIRINAYPHGSLTSGGISAGFYMGTNCSINADAEL